MAIRRTTGISSVVSSIDRRVKGVESGQTSLSAQYANAITVSVSDDDDPNLDGPDTTSGVSKKYEYKRILKAYIYGDKVTGFGSRCELYFGEDPQIEAKDPLDVQAVHGTSTDNFNISPKQYKVYETDTSPWTGRQSWRNTPTTGNNGDTITNTVWFNPVVEVPSTYSRTSGRELITTRRIDTMSVTGSTVTVTLNTTHLFEVGDVIYVDSISTHTVLFGADGLFKVSEVVSSTVIKYELDSPVPSPFSLTSVQVGTKYVYPVARRYVKDGEVWVDKSVEPNRVWVWNVLRWYDTAEPIGDVAAEQDGIAPSPVTGLDVVSELPAGTQSPVLNLTWTPPTTRSDSSSISGFLDGYDIWYKRSTESVWKKEFVKDGGQGIAAHQIKDAVLLQNFTYNIRVYTVDIMGQYSTVATDNVLTAKYAETLNAPSTPTATSKLGTITVVWDGLDSAAALPVPGVLYIEFHESTTSGFTPSSSTLVESVPITNSGNFIVRTGRLFDGTTFYYYKTRFVRQISPTELETSTASTQSTGLKVVGVTGPDVVANSITTNNLEAGFVTASLVRGDVIRAGASSTSARVELKSTGISAFNGVTGDPATFTVSSFDGSVNITGGTLTAPAITGGTLQTNSEATTGVKINTSGVVAYNNATNQSVFSVDSSNGSVVISGGSLTSPTITGGILQTSASANTGIKITTSSLTAYNIGGSPTFTVDAGTGNVTLSGGTLTGPVVRSNAPITGNAARVEMSTEGFFCFDASGNAPFRAYANGVVFMSEGYTGTLSANNITTGTLTGRSVQTAAAGGKRVLMSQASNSVIFYDSNGNEVGRMEGVTTGGGSLDLTGSGTASINIGLASTTVAGNLSTSGTANIFAAGRLGQNSWALTGTRVGGVSYNNTGLLVPSASDQRLKTNVESIPLALEKILELNPVTFNWKTDDTNPSKVPGLIAQEVSQVFGESEIQIVRRLSEIDPDPASEFYSDPMMAVEYEAIIPYLIKAMQELSTKNEALEARLAALEGNG